MPLLLPREHGAYGQLGIPIATALAAGRPSTAAWLLVIACVAAFVALEPVMVLLGRRGPRARREHHVRAQTAAWLTGSVAAAAAIGGVLLLCSACLWTLAVPGMLALGAMPFFARHAEKSVAAELYIATVLSSCALPIGVAAGLRPQDATACALVFALGFCAATLAVRATIAVQRREPSLMLRAGAIVLALGSPLLVRMATPGLLLGPMAWTAAVPLALLSLVLAASPPKARYLHRIGWSLSAVSTVAAIVLVLVIRARQASP